MDGHFYGLSSSFFAKVLRGLERKGNVGNRNTYRMILATRNLDLSLISIIQLQHP